MKRIPGANMSAILGAADIAMRIWLKPDRLAQLGITAQEVAEATTISRFWTDYSRH